MSKITAIALLGCAGFLGWRSLAPDGQETALLHTAPVANQDHFATVWVVDDGPYLWIRAESRSPRWLAPVLAHPTLELRRAGETRVYDAVPFDKPEAIARVNALFREKYGWSDRFREFLDDRDPLPIRLERR